MAVAAGSCPEDSRLRVLSVNVQMGNRRAEPLLELVRRHEPDLLFAMETDAWWNERLATLHPAFPHRIDHVGDDYFGLHLLSKYPLVQPEVRFLSERDAPAALTGVLMPVGQRIEFYGIHPKPPTMAQPSTWRDAQTLATAMLARAAPGPVVVAGDLNAVPWERVVRRALRVGELLDPRVGRGYVATYDVQQPWFWWPLDQVLFQQEFALVGFERLPEIGSDHYPLLVELCHLPAAADRQAAPAPEAGDLAETRRALEAGLRPEAWPLPLRAD
jgi:endonuclease/exonuclease/phosphatase (EEP) superfamily protein YafD